MPEYPISQLDMFEECALQNKFLYTDTIKRYEEEKANQYWGMRNLLVPGESIPGEKLVTMGDMIAWVAEISKSHGIEQRATLRNREHGTRR